MILGSDQLKVIKSSIYENSSKTQTYIIRLQPPTNVSYLEDLTTWHESFLPPNSDPKLPRSQIIYSYSEAIIGFSAILSKDAIKYMMKKEGFLKAYADRTIPLLTTHTPDFLELHVGNGAWNNSHMGKGIIIGVLDTGIWPGHPSFDDNGMAGPPSKWKGRCDFDKGECNRKLIGARRFQHGDNNSPPMDFVGHGTHTASTAAGNFVDNASVLGCGNGTAVGMAPGAHLSIYQVCSSSGCKVSDILAGLDAAIEDVVDVLSISIGGESTPFYDDVIAIGAYSAVKKGIFVSCSAGNSGPHESTVSNEAPWILTVGASTMDRKFRAVVKLGDGQEFEGESLFQSKTVYGRLIDNSGLCNFVTPYVKGKIVLCDNEGSSSSVAGSFIKYAGGIGLISANTETVGYTTLAELDKLPTSNVNYANALAIKKYIQQSKNATASISFKGTIIGTSLAPIVAFFSSRGPSKQTSGILKPDIIGPGVNILAAWPSEVTSILENEPRKTYNVISGTSMSAPHLSGVTALIKGLHSNWSPAAIKSAIMTTSDVLGHDEKPIMDERLHPASYFSMGAGHVNPTKAIDPGLIYEINLEEYIGLLCALGYLDKKVQTITHEKVTCEKVTKVKEVDLNYPSIIIPSEGSNSITVNRTVTNVGEPTAKYIAEAFMPNGVSIVVSPKVLKFSKVNEKKSFTVSLSWQPDTTAVGNLIWVSKNEESHCYFLK